MGTHGTVVELRVGGYSARVAESGATLLSLTYGGHQLVDPAPADDVDPAWRGRTLVPWPNRVVDGRYEVAGTAYQLPVNEPATGAALHGLAAFQRWRLTSWTASSATFALDLPGSDGYPFRIRCETSYAVDAEAGLTVSIAGTNAGPSAAPFGAATHPYITCDRRPLDECTLTLPARSVLLTDARNSPTEVVPAGQAGLDLTEPRLLRGLTLDHAFSDLPPEWAVELTHPATPGVRVTSTAPWVQLYTAEPIGRRSLAVEPMTCPPDAFNRDPKGVLLAPGETRRLSSSISVATTSASSAVT